MPKLSRLDGLDKCCVCGYSARASRSCYYCSALFCNRHIRPKKPSESSKAYGHVCDEFVDYLIEKSKREIDGRSVKVTTIDNSSQINSPQQTNTKNKTTLSTILMASIFGIILIFSLGLLFQNTTLPSYASFLRNTSLNAATPQSLSIIELIAPKNCSLMTVSGQCFSTKPLYCDNGKSVERSDICGCNPGFRAFNKQCIPEVYCSDGTLSPDCSSNRPLKCMNGTLVEKATECGCPSDFTLVGESCISPYKTGESTRTFSYIVRGQKSTFTLSVYSGLKNYLATLPRSYSCYEPCPTGLELDKIFTNRLLDNEPQKPELDQLVDFIKSQTQSRDDQARIAISLVQNIPYDYAALNSGNLNGRYPYEVLYDNAGVCGEKAPLLAVLLKRLGFSTVLFDFTAQRHQAVGIKCPAQYSFRNSGYCFVESTAPTIVTDDQGDYVSVGKLTSEHSVIIVSDGASFDSVSEEYADAREFISIRNGPQQVDSQTYAQWQELSNKYGLETGSSQSQITSASCTEEFCNGACYQSCGSNYIFSCTSDGGHCEADSNNCPSGQRACDGQCWSDCPSGSVWQCSSSGPSCIVAG